MTDGGGVAKWLRANREAQVDFLAELVKVPSDNPPGDCAAHALQPPTGESVEKMISLILEPDAMADSRVLIKRSTTPE